MSAHSFPTFFLSHGAPTLALDDVPASRFLKSLGASLPKPRAVIVFSAHHDAATTTVTSPRRPKTIHDFTGFEETLYDLEYPAFGDPALAERIVTLLEANGFTADVDPERGLDHGAWVPLSLLFPAADVPVVQVSINSRRDATYHFKLGEVLRPLRDDGFLILGTGSISHNLRMVSYAKADAAAPEWVTRFCDWMAKKLIARDLPSLLDYRALAPDARKNHPSDEHLMPLYCALGAANDDAAVKRIHHSVTYGVIAMDSYRFGGEVGKN
ncbi:DODA-type extradiol aromatic ring-opening family dioxygenase [Allohahella sp. A8]|uniref:DODA-type extradiol aromatic ring-opening family dioxygenase n=1 Tax=Allohahella sp. A8 TaxID=3141461 RepID=UPI003A7FEE98